MKEDKPIRFRFTPYVLGAAVLLLSSSPTSVSYATPVICDGTSSNGSLVIDAAKQQAFGASEGKDGQWTWPPTALGDCSPPATPNFWTVTPAVMAQCNVPAPPPVTCQLHTVMQWTCEVKHVRSLDGSFTSCAISCTMSVAGQGC